MMKEQSSLIEEVTHNIYEEKKQSERWFKPCDFFIVRTPLLSLDTYLQVMSQHNLQSEEAVLETIERLKKETSTSIFKEAISIASPSLRSFYEFLNISKDEADKKTIQKVEKTLISLFRYFIRMSTRTTPFGLFSRVVQGHFGDRSDLEVRSFSDNQKRARPDMEWIFHVIKLIESDPIIFDELKVRMNKTLMVKGNRVKLPFRPQYGILNFEAIPEGANSIGLTKVVGLTLQAAKEPVDVKTLKRTIQEAFPESSLDIIHNYLRQLLEQEFIISELRPPFMDIAPLEHIGAVLSGISGSDKWLKILSEIQALLLQYENSEIGNGEGIYHQLTEKMMNVVKTSNLVQVDVRLKKDVTLPRSITDDVVMGAELMCKLHVPEGHELNEYLNRFLEKYGVYQEIPIHELFDSDWGLGIPKAYQPDFISETQQVSYTRNSILFQLVTEAIAQGSSECVLTDEHIQELTLTHDPQNAPESLEIYYSLIADSQEQVDQGDYKLVLGASAGSSGAGKTFGRFLDMFDPSFIQNFEQIQTHIQRLHPQAAVAEMVFMPSSGRISNIMIGKNLSEYEIVSGTNSSKNELNTLHIDDLLVGATYDRFYIKSKKLGREIIPLQTHMFNHRISPPIFRFLSDVTRNLTKTWSYFNWGPVEQSPFLPRLRYKNIILSSAQWRLGKHTMGVEKFGGRREWLDKFYSWKKKWKVPRYIYLAMGDNRLLLDLHNPLCIEELRREMGKMQNGQELLLTECMNHPSCSPLHSKGESYTGEFVFPLLNTKSVPQSIPERGILDNSDYAPIASRGVLPGEDWLYIKLYGTSEREVELLGLYLEDLWKQPEFNHWCRRFYFVRYRDQESHIRLRFNGDSKELWSTGIGQISQWMQKLRNLGLAVSMTIDTYIPELERYGGEGLIEIAEDVFAADSKLVSLYLGESRRKRLNLAPEVIAVANILDILACFGLTLEEQKKWLEERVDGKEHMKAYRELKKTLIEAADSNPAWLYKMDASNLIIAARDERRALIKTYAESIENAKDRGLTNHPHDILASLVHMHLNRLLGVDRELEIKCMALAKYTASHYYHAKGALHVIS